MRKNAFTLVEMLITLGVGLALMAITIPAFASYIREGRKAMEISAARKIIQGYLSYAADNDGLLMSGYGGSGDPTYDPNEVRDIGGSPLGFPANARYPWRLAPYLDFDMRAILFNGNQNALDDKVDRHYAASVQPNLGMNVTFVGGDYGSTSDLVPSDRAMKTFGPFCIQRLTQANRPSELVVFASARRTIKDEGFYQVKSPYLQGRRWAQDWNPKSPPESFGYVDFRYAKKAVTALLDGHVQLMGPDELDDMRHWSNQAAENDDPHFSLTRVTVITLQ